MRITLHSVDFVQTLLAIAVGSGLTLVGIWMTNRHQATLARQADVAALRDRKHDRLRAAYRDVVAAADAIPRHAVTLGIMELEGRRTGNWNMFLEAIQSVSGRDVSQARANLLLEAVEDQVVLEKLGNLSMEHWYFVLSTVERYKQNGPPRTEGEDETEALHRMQDLSEELAELAHQRLAELEKPVG